MKCVICGAFYKKSKDTNASLYHECSDCRSISYDLNNDKFGLFDEPDVRSILNPTGKTQPVFYD